MDDEDRASNRISLFTWAARKPLNKCYLKKICGLIQSYLGPQARVQDKGQ